ncbi:MAG: WbqC family protein [Thermonemataceae bacterium]
MASLLIELQYLPPLEYFTALLKHSQCLIDIHENYQKQSYRNRCYLCTTHGVQALSIPVVKGNTKQKMKDVRIDYTQKWLQVHWRTITSSYGKAPFFEYYIDFFYDIFFKKPTFLTDLNQSLLTLCLRLIDIQIPVVYTEKYIEKGEFTDMTDARAAIHPKKSYRQNLFYMPKSYEQHFGSEFVPNMSILDLLFCEGNNAKYILCESLHS